MRGRGDWILITTEDEKDTVGKLKTKLIASNQRCQIDQNTLAWLVRMRYEDRADSPRRSRNGTTVAEKGYEGAGKAS